MTYAAFIDTCVLYPMYLRDNLLRLAVANLYQPLWSREVLDELHSALVREQATSPASPAVVIRTLARQTERYKREPKTLDGLLVALSRAGARTFADEVRRLTA